MNKSSFTTPVLAGLSAAAITSYIYPNEVYSFMGTQLPAFVGTGAVVAASSFISHSAVPVLLSAIPHNPLPPATEEKLVASAVTGTSSLVASKLLGNSEAGLNMFLIGATSEMVGSYGSEVLFG